MSGLDHLVSKTLEAAAGHTGALSTGEALAAALVLNRSDWLAKMGYTIPQALERIGPEWCEMIITAADVVNKTKAAIQAAATTSAEEAALEHISAANDIQVNADLVTYGSSPGYRHVYFTLDVTRLGGVNKHRIEIRLDKKNTQSLLEHIIDVHRVAWHETGPIDKEGVEKPPKWLSLSSQA